MSKSETLVVNFFGGPSTGKSTTAAGVFHALKKIGVNCEYVHEYAKEKTWEEENSYISVAKKCQPYITGKQFYRQFRLLGKVEIMISDSPLPLGIVYQGFGCTKDWEKWVIESFGMFNNLNIFLTRNRDYRPYNPAGRSQTEEEAIEKDGEIKQLLDHWEIPYHTVFIEENYLDKVMELVQNARTM